MCRRLISVIVLTSVFILVCVTPEATHAQNTETMSLSATVPPRPTDYHFTVTATPGDHQLHQGREIEFTIQYNSTLASDTSPVIIRATFQPGRINGSPIASLYPAEILYDSATNGYSETEPIINPITHSISWTIPTLPALPEDETVTFRARLNESYTGVQNVDVDVVVQFITPYVTLNQTITKSYLYQPIIITPTPIPTSVPSPTPVPLQLGNTTIHSISDVVATLSTSTSVLSTVTLYYGSTPLATGTKIQSNSLSRNHAFTISPLNPNTDYYYYLIATDPLGRSYRSTRMTFKTAHPSTPALLDKYSLLISSDDTIFNPGHYSQKSASASPSHIMFPVNTQYGVQLYIPDAITVKTVQAQLRSPDVLGISINSLFPDAKAVSIESSTDTVDLTETSPGIFMGSLKTKPRPGEFNLIIRISDVYGNISETVVSNIQVVRPFTVLQAATNSPAEHARIFLSRYNEKSATFIPLSPSFLQVRNPVYTNNKGEVSFVLPEGRYKADVTHISSEKTIEFTIGENSASGFPLVLLSTSSTKPLSWIRYQVNTLLDIVFIQTITFVRHLGESIAVYDLTGALALVALVFVTFMAFISRTLFNFTMVWRFIIKLIHTKHPVDSSPHYITGTVSDGDTGKAIALASIHIIDISTNTVLATLRTDRSGHYFAHTDPNRQYAVSLSVQGYEQMEPMLYDRNYSPDHLTHKLYRNYPDSVSILHTAKWFAVSAFGWLFELLLTASVVFELVFMEYYGLAKTLPYIAVSTINLTMWIAYLRHKSKLAAYL